MADLVFEAVQDADGGYCAECLTENIFTQGDTWEDLRSNVIDTTTNAIVGTITATQTLGRVSINPVTHRAYLTAQSGKPLQTARLNQTPFLNIGSFCLRFNICQMGVRFGLLNIGTAAR